MTFPACLFYTLVGGCEIYHKHVPEGGQSCCRVCTPYAGSWRPGPLIAGSCPGSSINPRSRLPWSGAGSPGGCLDHLSKAILAAAGSNLAGSQSPIHSYQEGTVFFSGVKCLALGKLRGSQVELLYLLRRLRS